MDPSCKECSILYTPKRLTIPPQRARRQHFDVILWARDAGSLAGNVRRVAYISQFNRVHFMAFLWKMRFLAVLAVLAGVATSTAAVNGPELGKPAPALTLSRILNAPSDANVTWQALHGKVVVIEFWATWCRPCRESIPHWNELVEAFKDKPVQFLAITDENVQAIATFLKQTPIHSWVGFDGPGKSMRDLYGIQGIPTTVIVDTNGIVAGVAHIEAVQPKHIRQILACGKSSLPAPIELRPDFGR